MADRFSDEQLAELKKVFSSAEDTDKTADLHEFVQLMRDRIESAFTAEEMNTISAAAAALDVDAASRPQWTAAAGRGQFFVFEGLDRSGKSTQSKRLHKHLEQAAPVQWMCFPDRSTPSGALIDLYLRKFIELSDEAVHRLFSANRWEAAQNIVAALNSGTSIVCDRYAFSGVAYSSAKGLDFEWCQAPDLGLPVPDAVFFLHIDEKVGASRANFGDERYENATMQSTVRGQFKLPALRQGVNWHDVDGAREIEVISTEIRDEVERVQNAEQENANVMRPIQRLWMNL